MPLHRPLTVSNDDGGDNHMSDFFAQTEPIRRYLYGLLAPALALLVAYGIIDDSAVALIVALGAAVLVPGGVEAARRQTFPAQKVTDYIEEH